MSCETCKGYSDHNCPTCRSDWCHDKYDLIDGTGAIAEQLERTGCDHPDGISAAITNWCLDNCSREDFDEIYELMHVAVTEERKMRHERKSK